MCTDGAPVEEDVDAGLAYRPEGVLERGDGRGRGRVAGLPERLPVAGELPHGGVGLVESSSQGVSPE
ncbi:hypothetical protein ABZ714_24770 [Streptomyces sp. NPDC006798]|uniref:hypothetical protein n=1 Tax=Streptomyces sp. NPDC006798 TaxID=3155462 RepID=UPI00340D3E2E